MNAIRIDRDGNAMGALIGADLQEGEAEWELIEPPGTVEEQRTAGPRVTEASRPTA